MKPFVPHLKAMEKRSLQRTAQSHLPHHRCGKMAQRIHVGIIGTTGILGLFAATQVAIAPKVVAQTTPAYCSILYGIDNTGTTFSKIYNVNVTNATYNAATANSGATATNTAFLSAAAALEASTGRLFYVSRDTTSTKTAYWDPANNTHTQLSTTFNAGSTVVRAAFSPSGRLFVATSTILFEINPTTGAQISSTTLHGVSAPSGGNGDMAFDGNNVLFLASDNNLYTIDIDNFSASSPANLLAQAPAGTTFNSLGFKPDGKLYAFAGSNRTMYEVNTNSGNLTIIGTITFNPATGAGVVGTDYASCAQPTPNLQSTKTYTKVSGSTGSDILPGDVVEYTVTIINTGSVPATKVTFKDPIPAGSTYVAGSTTMNGTAVTDATGGTFLFANGATIQSPGLKPGVIGTGSTYQVVIKYRIRVNTVNPPTSIINQGTTFYLGGPTGGVPTDDPNTSTPTDPTVTTITPATTTISGTLYEDSDGGDDLDSTEPKLPANIIVKLLDSNNNLVTTTNTAADGTYTFTNISNGNYKIQVDTTDTDIPAGYTLGTPNDLAVTVSGSPVTNKNFGFDPPTYSISGTLYKDNNNNNTNDSEPALAANVTVTLYKDNDNDNIIDAGEQVGSPVLTNASGQYSFSSIPVGTYKIKVDTTDTDIPNGYTLGTANDLTATITNTNITGKDFGFDQPTYSISGTLYEDIDGGDDLDVTEPKLPANITVKLLDTNNNPIQTTTTDANGTYTFTDVVNGNYKIQVDTTDTDIPADYTLGTPNDLAVTVSGSSVNNQNFGFDPPPSNPNILLVKRITAINGTSFTNLIDGVNNSNSPDYVPTPHDTDDNNSNWPSNYLQGLLNGGTVRPNDEIEYTIYFLSAGDATAPKVLMCDRVPDNVTFIPTAFNSDANFPQVNDGIPGSDRGIAWLYNGNKESLTNVKDGDVAQYFPPGKDPKTVYPNIKCDGSNTNGAVVVNLGNLPNATAAGTPTNSYGFIRFQGRVK